MEEINPPSKKEKTTMTTENTNVSVSVKRTLNEKTNDRIAFHENLIAEQTASLAAAAAAGKTDSKGFARTKLALEKNVALCSKLRSQMQERLVKAEAKAAASVVVVSVPSNDSAENVVVDAIAV